MEKLSQYVVNLKDQTTDVATYQWTVDEEFFSALEATEVQRGCVGVQLTVRRTSGAYELTFGLQGKLTLQCDRCLEDMELPIEAERLLRVKLGDEYDDDGELLTIPADDGTLNVAWPVYEFIALEIPLRHVHPDGACEGTMSAALDAYEVGSDTGEPIDENSPWAKLKEILNNN